MDDRNEKVSDSVERDIQGAVKMGADAARTAKTLGKAAAHAAAGDVAGAAAEVVKDPETLKKIDELATDIMGFWSGDLSGIGVSQSEDDTAQEPEDELEEEPTA